MSVVNAVVNPDAVIVIKEDEVLEPKWMYADEADQYAFVGIVRVEGMIPDSSYANIELNEHLYPRDLGYEARVQPYHDRIEALTRRKEILEEWPVIEEEWAQKVEAGSANFHDKVQRQLHHGKAVMQDSEIFPTHINSLRLPPPGVPHNAIYWPDAFGFNGLWVHFQQVHEIGKTIEITTSYDDFGMVISRKHTIIPEGNDPPFGTIITLVVLAISKLKMRFSFSKGEFKLSYRLTKSVEKKFNVFEAYLKSQKSFTV